MATTNKPRVDTRDWSKLTLGERIRHVEMEGYVVIPDLLSPELIAKLKQQTASLETTAVDYSPHQRGRPHMERESGAIIDLIAHEPTTAFLRELFGDEVVVMHYTMAVSQPGHPGISLHTDGQPYGSKIFGYEGSCPVLVRVLYYLDDLTEEVSPFLVVPRSHLSMHADANPYHRYARHPEQVMVPVKAGGAVFLNHRCFHGNFPNTGKNARTMLAIAYRPKWAGPADKVDEWDEGLIASLPSAVQPYFSSRNARIWEYDGANRPANMREAAPGINPSRWERTS